MLLLNDNVEMDHISHLPKELRFLISKEIGVYLALAKTCKNFASTPELLVALFSCKRNLTKKCVIYVFPEMTIEFVGNFIVRVKTGNGTMTLKRQCGKILDVKQTFRGKNVPVYVRKTWKQTHDDYLYELRFESEKRPGGCYVYTRSGCGSTTHNVITQGHDVVAAASIPLSFCVRYANSYCLNMVKLCAPHDFDDLSCKEFFEKYSTPLEDVFG